MASEYEKMIAGDFYRPADPELRALAQASREKQEAFNQEVDPPKGVAIIKEWFGSTGENLYLNRQVLCLREGDHRVSCEPAGVG